jgi:hypothetical protein
LGGGQEVVPALGILDSLEKWFPTPLDAHSKDRSAQPLLLQLSDKDRERDRESQTRDDSTDEVASFSESSTRRHSPVESLCAASRPSPLQPRATLTPLQPTGHLVAPAAFRCTARVPRARA